MSQLLADDSCNLRHWLYFENYRTSAVSVLGGHSSIKRFCLNKKLRVMLNAWSTSLMRRSGRLAQQPAKQVLEISDDESEGHEEGPCPKSPRKRKEPVFEEVFSEQEEDADESNEPEQPLPPKPMRPKKSFRTSTKLPPVRPCLMDGPLFAATEWSHLISKTNASFKQRCKQIRIKFVRTEAHKVQFETGRLQPYMCRLQACPAVVDTNTLEVIISNRGHQLKIGESLLLDGRTALSAMPRVPEASKLYCCLCPQCQSSADHVFVYAVCDRSVLVYLLTFTRVDGLTGFSLVGRVEIADAARISTCLVQDSALLVVFSSTGAFGILDLSLFKDKRGVFEAKLRCSLEDSVNISTISWCPFATDRVLVGSTQGDILLWSLRSDGAKLIYQSSLPHKACIYSLAWIDASRFVVGSQSNKLYSFDLNDPFSLHPEVSTLPFIPEVTWSPALQSILFADSDFHARRLSKELREDGSQNYDSQPLGTYDSPVLSIAGSCYHDLTATGNAGGFVQLSWMGPDALKGVEFEKRICRLQLNEDNQLVFDPHTASYVQFQKADTFRLYPSRHVAVCSVAWSTNINCPGVLFFSCANGLLCALSCDSLFI